MSCRPLLYVMLLLSLCLWEGCTPICNDCTSPTAGRIYVPTSIGHYIEYEVVEEDFLLNKSPQKNSYQIKEVITEGFINAAGQSSFRIQRFRRSHAAASWQPDSVYSLRLTPDYAIRNENSLDFVKIVFPIFDKSNWNGNIYNHLGEDRYELVRADQPFTIGNRRFDKTVTVIQQNDSTLVGQDKRIEVYAEGIGLVYRERIGLQFCSSTPACIGKAQIDFGRRQYVRFLNSGKQ
ncbi:MAG: hypothetical protein ACK4GN_02520 [Runella sp.]